MNKNIALGLLALVALAACNTVTVYEFQGGRMRKVGTFTEEEYWIYSVTNNIGRELRKGLPPISTTNNWGLYWSDQYTYLRNLTNGEEKIEFIKAKRAENGLPSYEDKK